MLSTCTAIKTWDLVHWIKIPFLIPIIIEHIRTSHEIGCTCKTMLKLVTFCHLTNQISNSMLLCLVCCSCKQCDTFRPYAMYSLLNIRYSKTSLSIYYFRFSRQAQRHHTKCVMSEFACCGIFPLSSNFQVWNFRYDMNFIRFCNNSHFCMHAKQTWSWYYVPPATQMLTFQL